MATDVDQVKKKIRNLDDTIINIEKKLKSFLKRYTKFVRKNQEKI